MTAFDPNPDGHHPQAWSAQQLGASSHWRSLQSLLTDEQLTHCWRGSYATPVPPLPIRLQALQAAVGVPLVACHQTAASLHSFGVLDDGLLHVTALDGRSLRRRSGVVMHQWVPRRAPVEIGGLLVTAAADAAIDVSRTCPEIDVLPVLDAALRAGVDNRALATALEVARGRRGVRSVKHWTAFADAAAESPMESRTRYRALAGGLPAPELQVRVAVTTGDRWLDMGWRQRRIGLEYDGEEFHSGDGRLAQDRRRRNELLQAGWTVLHATATDIWRNPLPLLTHLRALLS